MQAMADRRDELAHAGRWLREQREAAGLTQAELADSFGGKMQNVSAYELGIHRPSDDKAAAMAEILGIAVNEMRRQFGLYVPDGAVDKLPRELTPEEAIRRDPHLIPEARRHLLKQLALLRRLSPPDMGTATSTPSDSGPDADILDLPHAARKRPPRKRP
jgi:transcriptional regulator with XRE-family HTH domain